MQEATSPQFTNTYQMFLVHQQHQFQSPNITLEGPQVQLLVISNTIYHTQHGIIDSSSNNSPILPNITSQGNGWGQVVYGIFNNTKNTNWPCMDKNQHNFNPEQQEECNLLPAQKKSNPKQPHECHLPQDRRSLTHNNKMSATSPLVQVKMKMRTSPPSEKKVKT